MEIFVSSYASPHSLRPGDILIAQSEGLMVSLDFADFRARFEQLLKKRWPQAILVSAQVPGAYKLALDAYFAGDLRALDCIKVKTSGTAFQDQVWHVLRSIPPGKTWSYGQLAEALGKPKASRAVGRTNGLNPIALVLPCHRVVGANGKLTGYAGGLARKEWLLHHEGVLGQALPLALPMD